MGGMRNTIEAMPLGLRLALLAGLALLVALGMVMWSYTLPVDGTGLQRDHRGTTAESVWQVAE